MGDLLREVRDYVRVHQRNMRLLALLKADDLTVCCGDDGLVSFNYPRGSFLLLKYRRELQEAVGQVLGREVRLAFPI
jgi:hypothetical protein